MKSRVLPSCGLALAAVFAAPAQAAPLGQFVATAVLFGIPPQSTPCASLATPSVQSKAEALLNGAPSALSRITGMQEGAPAAFTIAPARTCAAPAPATGQAGIVPVPALPGARRNEFLASTRLAVSRTPFDRQWDRVSAATLSTRTLQRIDPAVAGDDLVTTLTKVNAWANSHIRYREDRDLYGAADYWASARQTLSRRAGDCEDIAILKYQLLAAAGVPRDAMFLTVARDLVRHADHAVLIVRANSAYWMLDNSTNALVDAGSAQDYRPIFSFGTGGKWLHGYRGELAAVPVPAPAPALNAR